jgi:hypothetical protein
MEEPDRADTDEARYGPPRVLRELISRLTQGADPSGHAADLRELGRRLGAATPDDDTADGESAGGGGPC